MDWRRARIFSQIVFFILFFILFLFATYPYNPMLSADFFLQWSPLVALTTFLSSHYIIAAMVPAIVILFLTLFLGRIFCGWVCPLGSTIDFTDNRIKRKKSNQPTSAKWRWLKYGILVSLIVLAIFGKQLAWFFDPLALFNRTLTLVLYPMFSALSEGIFTVLFEIGLFEDTIDSLYAFLQTFLLPLNEISLRQSIFVGVIFLTIISFGVVSRRFWCRNLCPLGALLGLFSRFRLIDRKVDSDSCIDCNICRRDCRMNAIASNYKDFAKTECINAMECANSCPEKSIKYTFAWRKDPRKVDFKRRQFLQSATVGVASYALLQTDFINRNEAEVGVRPPGSVPEDQFLDRCIRCQECVRICSTTGALLQPAWFEHGLEGIWSPMGNTRHGYCEYTCNLCGEICPTDAIHLLPLEEKQKTVIGTAFFEKSRCIPWYSGDNCMVCEEHCPTPEKAIISREAKFVKANGEVVQTKYPYVVEDLCIGCGICEAKCPVVSEPGIFVTREREQRYME
jgi:polyferredoxin